nr:OB-fold nucleic acid binding domain-containing protein [Listeria aquatica]
MSFLTVSDDSGELSAVAFPEAYRNFNLILQEGELLALQVKIEERNGEKQAIINQAEQLDKIEIPKRLFIKVESDEQVRQLKMILKEFKGNSRVVLHYATTKKNSRTLRFFLNFFLYRTRRKAC